MSRSTDATAPAPHGRELAVGTPIFTSTEAVVSLLTGGALALVNLTGHTFGAWQSPESLSPGLIGAAMLGVTPGLFAVGRARAWEEVRTLVLPLVRRSAADRSSSSCSAWAGSPCWDCSGSVRCCA